MTIICVYIFDKKYNPTVLLYLTKDSVIYIGNIILIIYYVVCYLCHIYWQDNILVYISKIVTTDWFRHIIILKCSDNAVFRLIRKFFVFLLISIRLQIIMPVFGKFKDYNGYVIIDTIQDMVLIIYIQTK